MRVKITDFLITIGNICNTNSNNCKDCPFNFINEEHRKVCAIDFLKDKDIAEKVKRIVLKQMKVGAK